MILSFMPSGMSEPLSLTLPYIKPPSFDSAENNMPKVRKFGLCLAPISIRAANSSYKVRNYAVFILKRRRIALHLRIDAEIMYIHRLNEWPDFTWDSHSILLRLGNVRHRQGKLLGQMMALGRKLQEKILLDTLTLDVTKSSEIEGERLNTDQVRSSIARRLGMDIAGAVPSDRNVEGVVEMMLDATQRYQTELTEDRLFGWHAALFPTGRSGMHKITVGDWRKGEGGPMQVVSGPMGREKVHFQAPDSVILPKEMNTFLKWFNSDQSNDPVIKAAITHLWFVTLHPFDDGNGHITRALTDMLLARADESPKRFYSMSAQILREKSTYYTF